MGQKQVIVGVILVAVVIVFLAVLGVQVTMALANNLQSGSIATVVHLNGDNVEVILAEGSDVSDLSAVAVYFDGTDGRMYTFRNVMPDSPLLCEKMGKDVRGWKTVIIEVIYQDGERVPIGFKNINFG
jgi:hypothetical protein